MLRHETSDLKKQIESSEYEKEIKLEKKEKKDKKKKEKKEQIVI